MSFVEQEDIITTFEGMAKHLFKTLRGVELAEPFQRMSWADAMKYYGSDNRTCVYGMKFVELMDIMKGHGFSVFDMLLMWVVSVPKVLQLILVNNWMH